MGFACKNCKSAVLLSHPETKQAQEGWLKCPLCGFCRKERKMFWKSKIALKKRIAELKSLISSHVFHINALNTLISVYDKDNKRLESLNEKLQTQLNILMCEPKEDYSKWPYKCFDGTEHEYPEEWNSTIISNPPCKKCGLVKED